MSKPHLFMKGGKWVAAINVGPDNLIRAAGDTPLRAHICAVLMAKKAEREENERQEARAREVAQIKQMDDEATRGEWVFAAAWAALVAYCVYEVVC